MIDGTYRGTSLPNAWSTESENSLPQSVAHVPSAPSSYALPSCSLAASSTLTASPVTPPLNPETERIISRIFLLLASYWFLAVNLSISY